MINYSRQGQLDICSNFSTVSNLINKNNLERKSCEEIPVGIKGLEEIKKKKQETNCLEHSEL